MTTQQLTDARQAVEDALDVILHQTTATDTYYRLCHAARTLRELGDAWAEARLAALHGPDNWHRTAPPSAPKELET